MPVKQNQKLGRNQTTFLSHNNEKEAASAETMKNAIAADKFGNGRASGPVSRRQSQISCVNGGDSEFERDSAHPQATLKEASMKKLLGLQPPKAAEDNTSARPSLRESDTSKRRSSHLGGTQSSKRKNDYIFPSSLAPNLTRDKKKKVIEQL